MRLNKTNSKFYFFYGTFLIVLSIICVYGVEYALGNYYTKSLLYFPIPPHASQTHTTTDYSVTYTYNNFSLRGEDYIPKQIYDVVLVGDSFLFGQGVELTETLHGYLNQKNMSVLNVSEIATGPELYLHKMKIMAKHGLRANNVIIGLCMSNDFVGTGDKNAINIIENEYPEEPLFYNYKNFIRLERLRYRARDKWADILYNIGRLRSDSYQEILVPHLFEKKRTFYSDWIQYFTANDKKIMEIMKGGNWAPEKYPLLSELPEKYYLEEIELNENSMKSVSEILNAITQTINNANYFVLVIPTKHYAKGYRSEKYDTLVKKFSKQLNSRISFIDLSTRMQKEHYFTNDGHWNSSGHKLVSEIILQKMSKI